MEIKSKMHFQVYIKIMAFIWVAIVGASLTAAYCYAGPKSSILVIRATNKDFEDSMDGLKGELASEFSIDELLLSEELVPQDIKRKINTVSPKMVILMDNKAISLYKKYQESLSTAEKNNIPSVSIMGVFMNLALEGMANATGISYEVPVVTSIVSLRAALDRPFKKVGIVHRDILNDFVRINKEYCSKEGVAIINYEISSKDNIKKSVKKSLERLDGKDKVDAIWVPNDNNLLTADILQNVWMPFAKKFKKPIIVGVEVLVNPKFNFGTFAVIPDHKSLGMQAAEKVYEAMDNNWQMDSMVIDPPTSIYKIINYQQVKRWYNIDEDQLKNVDKIIK